MRVEKTPSMLKEEEVRDGGQGDGRPGEEDGLIDYGRIREMEQPRGQSLPRGSTKGLV